MLRFKQFLSEQFLIEEIENNDAKGKLHEILVAKHLSSDNDEDKQLPTHYRDEKTGKTPRQIHDKIVNDHMGDQGTNHPDYIEADRRAKEAAEHIKKHLTNKGHDFSRLSRVAWTSNKSDHEKFTGEGDENSNADVMLHFNAHDHELKTNPKHPGHYAGISLKIGKSQPTVKSPGFDTLNRLTKSHHSVTNDILDDHDQNIENAGYDREKSDDTNGHQYNKDTGKTKDSEKAYDQADPDRAKLADEHTSNTLTKLSSHYTNAINNLQKHEVHHLLKSLIAPDTKHPHITSRTLTSDSDNTTSHHITNPSEDFDDHFKKNNYHGYTAVRGSGKGHSIHIHEKKADGTLGRKLATIKLKTRASGPFSGFVTNVQSHI